MYRPGRFTDSQEGAGVLGFLGSERYVRTLCSADTSNAVSANHMPRRHEDALTNVERRAKPTVATGLFHLDVGDGGTVLIKQFTGAPGIHASLRCLTIQRVQSWLSTSLPGNTFSTPIMSVRSRERHPRSRASPMPVSSYRSISMWSSLDYSATSRAPGVLGDHRGVGIGRPAETVVGAAAFRGSAVSPRGIQLGLQRVPRRRN
jgi:hypothetical protein